jgi:hypothetical protein
LGHPSSDNPAYVVEQGLEVGGQRISGPMKMAYHLVQIIPKPHHLFVDKAINVAVARFNLRARLFIFIEEHRAPEMHRAHAEGGGAPLDAFQFTCG